ncbi:MAG TPA: thiamine-phosphate kinase [Gammaproteobacteria bacterium]|nr:thiamine-phosphate kinase [Gammaproteobacteria bacterium]
MNEFELIYELIAPAAGRRDDVLLGIGDDGAVLAPPPGEALVVVADTLVAGRHFPDGMDAADVGWRAAVVNLSDLAAMGATPRWATLALTLPAVDEAWLRAFVSGLRAGLDLGDVALVGGDTTRGPLTVTVQAMGTVPPAQALTRHGARVDELVFVSGTPGEAAGGLALWRQGRAEAAALELLRRFRRPTPRLALGLALRGLASACIDVSDGLLADLGHVATQSGAGMRLAAARLPPSPALRACFDVGECLRLAATGGDDYELAFTLPASRAEELSARAKALDCALTCIGTVTAEPGVRLVDAEGREIRFARGGYTHF